MSQQTITVNNFKIKIVVRAKTYCRNLIGYNIFINGEKYFINSLFKKDAIEKAFFKWAKKNIPKAKK